MPDVMTALSTLKPESSAAEALPARAVGKLFASLNGQLGGKLADLYQGVPVQDMQSEWAIGLAGFRGREIERGLAACRARPFAPNLGEFARLCRPCLDSDAAWIEAEHCLSQRRQGLIGDWSHPAVWRAACVMSREISAGEATSWNRKRWAAVLARELDKGWGDEVPEVPRQLAAEPAKTRGPTPEERAKIDALRSARIPTNESNEEAQS
ncbi:hypothetical protein [Variovorax sp. 278MFTsu5.1]|uniref:hypothetical protein n=1 Tax=Variovorax sp. 278MFTsu5.1 TaxID=3158366 RepID=UPI003AAAA6A8